jgi:hypothetical protein
MYGKVLMRHFRKDERGNITWVHSASEATTKSATEEFGIEKRSLDYRDILDGAAKPLMTVQRAAKHMEILFRIMEW